MIQYYLKIIDITPYYPDEDCLEHIDENNITKMFLFNDNEIYSNLIFYYLNILYEKSNIDKTTYTELLKLMLDKIGKENIVEQQRYIKLKEIFNFTDSLTDISLLKDINHKLIPKRPFNKLFNKDLPYMCLCYNLKSHDYFIRFYHTTNKHFIDISNESISIKDDYIILTGVNLTIVDYENFNIKNQNKCWFDDDFDKIIKLYPKLQKNNNISPQINLCIQNNLVAFTKNKCNISNNKHYINHSLLDLDYLILIR